MAPIKEWRFPPNNGGEITGFNNAALDHFKGQRLSSMVREVIQNSLDAEKLDDNQPINVKFKVHSVLKSEIPEVTLIRRHLLASCEEAEGQDNSVAVKFYENAIRHIDEDKTVKFLAIHDSNSKGLTGPTDRNFGSWAALVKGTGVSQKQSNSLGSFGHGSKAPFSLSHIRSLFYLSYVVDGKSIEKRFQGKSILQTHHIDGLGDTQGTGYFGWASSSSCSPLLDEEIPTWATNIREDVNNAPGTTLIIPYFQLSESEFPETAISCIANFFYAIQNGNLVVEIDGETTLDAKNIVDKYYYYKERLADEKDYIDHQRVVENFKSLSAIIEADDSGVQEVPGLDRFTWYIKLLDDADDKTTRVAIARKDGMLIKHNPLKLERFPLTRSFEMFVCVDGKRGSELLKKLENPKHDDFEFDRIEDPEERERAEKQYGRLADKIREITKRVAGIQKQDEKSDGTLNKWFKPTAVNDEHGQGIDRGKIISIGRTRPIGKIKGPNIYKPGDGPIVTQSGQGIRSGKGQQKTGDGPIPGPGTGIVSGKGSPTSSKLEFTPLRNLRSVPIDTKKVKLIFDNPNEGKHQMIVERVGEEGQERVQLSTGDGTYSDQVMIDLGAEPRQEIMIESKDQLSGFALRATLITEVNVEREE